MSLRPPEDGRFILLVLVDNSAHKQVPAASLQPEWLKRIKVEARRGEEREVERGLHLGQLPPLVPHHSLQLRL